MYNTTELYPSNKDKARHSDSIEEYSIQVCCLDFQEIKLLAIIKILALTDFPSCRVEYHAASQYPSSTVGNFSIVQPIPQITFKVSENSSKHSPM